MRRFLRRDPNRINSEENPNGLLAWISVLRTIKDKDLKLICGTDVALYIVFLRLSAKFFAWLTVFNCAILIPIYLTGYPETQADVQDINGDTSLVALITIMNITGHKEKVTIVYFLMTSFYVFAAFIFMYFYWRRSLEWRYKKHSHKDKFMDHDIALHSIMVTNLEKDVDLETMNEHLKLVFERLF